MYIKDDTWNSTFTTSDKFAHLFCNLVGVFVLMHWFEVFWTILILVSLDFIWELIQSESEGFSVKDLFAGFFGIGLGFMAFYGNVWLIIIAVVLTGIFYLAWFQLDEWLLR